MFHLRTTNPIESTFATRVLAAMCAWPVATGSSVVVRLVAHARGRRGGEPLERLSTDDWPSAGAL